MKKWIKHQFKLSSSQILKATLCVAAFPSLAWAQNIQTPAMWSQLKYTLHQKNNENNPALENLEDFGPQKELLSKFTYGVLAFQRGDHEEAKSFLNESLAVEELRPYIYFYLGQIATAQKQSTAAIAHLNRALALNPQSDLKRHIKFEMAKTLLGVNRLTDARASLQEARTLFRRTEHYPDVIWNLLVVDQRLGRSTACTWFKTMFRDYPTYNPEVTLWTLNSSTWSMNQGDKKVNLACSLSAADRRSHVHQLIALGQYAKTEYELNDPNLKIKELELLDLKTEFQLRAGDPKKAFSYLKEFYNNYKTNDDFLQLYTKAASRSMNHDEALKTYDERVRLAKTAAQKAQIVFRKGFLQYELGLYEQAYNTFVAVPQIHANGIYQGDVYWYLAWTSYLQKRYDLAIEHFETLLSMVNKRQRLRSRDSYTQDRVKYWLAQSYRLSGQDTVANAHFREIVSKNHLDYYAFLSAAFLNRTKTKGKTKVVSRTTRQNQKPDLTDPLLQNLKVPWADSNRALSSTTSTFTIVTDEPVDLDLNSESFVESVQESLEKNVQDDRPQVVSATMAKADLLKVFAEARFQPFADRFRLLSHLGFSKEARWELYELEKKARTKEQKKALAILYYQVDDSHRASRLLTLGFEQERRQPERHEHDPFYLWSSTYPQPHKKVVEASSMLFHVPENLVYSIMRAESFYSHQAMSGAGARGLLQLMPFTANRVADLLGKDGVSPDELFEPYINIQLGVRYLKRLLRAFEGDQVLAIAAYNAGPHRAEWWVSRFGHLRQDEFIEHILFLETRNYVKKVMRYNWIYDLLYNAEHPMSLAEIKNPLGFQLTRGPSLTEQWDSTE